jgi:chromosome segregation ATPase
MADVSRIQGSVEIQGLDQAVTGLNTLSTSFDKAGTSSTAALRQINQFGTLGQNTQTAATGVNALATANQQYTQAARARISVDDQLEKVQLRLRLAQTDASGRVAILRQQYEQLAAAARPLVLSQDEITKRTIAATQAAVQLANAERAVAREQQSQLATAASGVGRGVLQGIGAGGILGGLGLAGGIAIATRSIIDLGTETADLAIKAQTIGTAYEAATKRAGFAADDLLKKLDTAARGTASDTDLMAASNRALALGVGQNATQIADLLAIARQKGKDFGESTTQAFEDITTGLGRLSPRILDNLGILLQENEIYKKYADSIGVAEGKLSDQEKRQALVNELIRTNTDLITKNASANLDAADKIAAAQAREQTAKERLGQASLPIRVGAENAVASFFEALTGKPQEEALARSQALAKIATNYEDYVNRVNAARSKLTAGFHVSDPNELIQLTPQQFDLYRDMERLGDMAGRTKDDFAGLTQSIQANGQAAALTKEDYDRLGASLAILTDRGLRPYKAAVDQASDALKQHKASEQAAKDSVDAISTSLSAAKTRFQDFASAQLAGTKAYEDQLFNLDLAQAKIQKNLLEFQAPGAGLDQLLAPIQSQIDDAAASTDDWKQKLDAANQAVSDQEQALAGATAEQKNYDNAVGDAKDNLDAQQSRLSALQGVYDNLGTSIDDVRRKTEDLRRTSLVGEGALDDRLFAMDQQVKAQQLRIDQAKLGGAGKDEIKRLTEQLDKLRTAEDAARIAGELRYDKQHRALEQQGVPRDEKSYADASAAIADNQGKLDSLTEAQQAAGQAVKDQQKIVSDAKFDLIDATAVQRDHTKAVDAEKAALDKLKDAQKATNDQYSDAKQRLSDLKTQLDTTRTNALKPFQDQIDELDQGARGTTKVL